MIRMRPHPSLACALIFAAGLLLGGRAPAAAQESCLTSQCHATELAAKHVHAATESCDSCHQSIASPHPQAGEQTFELIAQGNQLCASCHDTFAGAAHSHPPLQDGNCTDCHDPHASDQPKMLVEAVPQLCANCHGDIGSATHPHGPVAAGECTACHAPHASEHAGLLVKAEDQLCFDCHGDLEAELARKNVHVAVESGCTSCHSPHGAEHPKLLAEAGAALCFQCHDAVAETVNEGAVVHAPVRSESACASCHSPHASDHAALLLAPEAESCQGCHKDVVDRTMTLLHGPVAEGQCTPCHQPHAGGREDLLKAAFPKGPYAPYSDEAYGLCFECHDADLAKFPDTSFATGFRDGERNLHFVHVNDARKGRSCALCHGLHGSANAKLVADRVEFGEWKLPIGFTKTETGGGCAPGCHRPYAYDRENPGQKPPPRPASR